MRLVRQLWGVPARIGEYLFSTLYYDLILSRQVVSHEGSVGGSRKVAVYLVYPTLEIQPSHIDALKYIVSHGYAPIVVSNLSLTESDRTRLLSVCHRCIERPNFGYDFGGYRDGILATMVTMSKPDRLLLINDSTWFDLPGNSDWLAECETLNVDLAAAASNFGIERVDPTRYRSIAWDYSTKFKNFHFCSFALLLSGNVVKDPRFRRFWKRLRLSNNKRRTVRYGEIGFSRWILDNGFTYGVPYDVSGLDSHLKELGDERLREVAENIIIPEDRAMLEIKHDVLAGSPSREDLISLILTCVARQGSAYALADYAINERRFPFLKKSPTWLSKEASDITLRLAGNLAEPKGSTILSEALKLRETKRLFAEN